MAKKRMSTAKALAIFTPCISLCVVLILAVAILTSMFWKQISMFISGRPQTADAAALADAAGVCEEIVEEGIVLLKNDKNALPLSKDEIEQVNVFGWAAYDWMTMAYGSGYSNTDQERTKLFPALEAAGIGYNKDLYNLYKDYYTAHNKTYGDGDYLEYRGGVAFGSNEIFVLREPSKSDYMKYAESIMDCSDVGLVVIGRTGSESKDLQLNQVRQTESGKNTKKTFTDRNYLQLSPEEEDMIEVATTLCDKVIVILNTANTMETGFIQDENIDAALLVGITGLDGVNGLVNVLRGEKEQPVIQVDNNGIPMYNEDETSDEYGMPIYEKNPDGSVKTEKVKVSPSGRTVDTYAYDILGTNPSTVNQSTEGGSKKYSNGGTDNSVNSYIDYAEGIYVGYRWYETADKENYWADVNNDYGSGYKGVVQYPFGYGLSYTDFQWTVKSVQVNGTDKTSGEVTEKDKITVKVEVKNIGKYPGADVVQLYYTAPYESGKPNQIEKAYVNLVAFAKTKVLNENEVDEVTLEFTVQDMASYDCYDVNGNGHAGYELDAGDYELKLMQNSHYLAENLGTKTKDNKDAAVTEAVITFNITERINCDKDSATGNDIENRFTNKDGKGNDKTIDRADLDGSHESVKVEYMTRADFKGTYPKKLNARAQDATALSIAQEQNPTAEQLEATGYSNAKRDTSAKGNGLKLSDALGTTDYNDEIWELLIANITNDELYKLVSDGYFKTAAIASIGKEEFVDLDGPLGFNTRVTGGDGTTCDFYAYPNGTMLAQTWNTARAVDFGHSVGRERKSMQGLRGWYAPGANTHRNPFGGRNGEYYSEDGVLAGKICAGTVSGAKDMGVYSYVKHFVVNDSELSREGLFTFLTEQTLREIYLKPFEIMIKEGGGNALMTSMNRLGRVWSGANYGLMTQIIRDEWGFKGTAVTDWVNASDTYMPPYKGIWAGNDIWLTAGIPSAFGNIKNETGYVIAEHVAKDVLWTFVDTTNAEKAYDAAASVDLSEGAVYNMSFVGIIVAVEVVLLAGAGIMGFFLAKTILRNRKPVEEASDNAEPVSDTNE